MNVPQFSLVHMLCIFSVALSLQLSYPHFIRPLRRESLLTTRSIATSPFAETSFYRDSLQTNTIPHMIPLSNPPLLLLQSSAPIISKEECNLLSCYFEDKVISESADASLEDRERAEAILHRLADTIDRVTNCRSHAGEMQIPRYVRYDAKVSSIDQVMSPEFLDLLLPDGLHVDTNNGKLFRHITAILYLTDNPNGHTNDSHRPKFVVGGGTSFPFAIPHGSQSTTSPFNSGANLLSRGIHHTKAANGELQDPDQYHLEQTAVDVIYRDMREFFGMANNFTYDKRPEIGIRVTPEAGKLIYFHNIGNDGKPDPNSFHGGEELVHMSDHPSSSDYKSILVFFKEIPLEKIKDIDSFAEEVQMAREWTINSYYAL